jgi:hypothetical protein
MAPAEMPGLFHLFFHVPSVTLCVLSGSTCFISLVARVFSRRQEFLLLRTFPTLLPAAKLPTTVVTSPAAEIPATSLPWFCPKINPQPFVTFCVLCILCGSNPSQRDNIAPSRCVHFASFESFAVKHRSPNKEK